MRRDLILGALALILVPATVATVLRLIPDLGPTTTRPYTSPAHRVAVAAEEALSRLYTSTTRSNMRVASDMSLGNPTGPPPEMGEVAIPADSPAFWYTFGGGPGVVAGVPTLVNLRTFVVQSQTRDGRTVKLSIRVDTIGKGSLVDFEGDATLAKPVFEKLADCLAHPEHKPGSPEDQAALLAFFSPKPTTLPTKAVAPAPKKLTETPGVESEGGAKEPPAPPG